MRFKACLTHDGVHLLDKRFLPALDKVGRTCHVYLTRDHAMFLHNLLSGDGVQCVAQFGRDLLFRDYLISSRNDDRIAFSVDLALLHRALRSALSILQSQGGGGGDRDPHQIQIKLMKKIPAGSQQSTPFLSFETKGYKSAVIHDVPISRPLSRDDVMELQSALDMAHELPQTLVQVPDLAQLQNLVDRLKNVGDIMSVSVTQYGDLHLQVSTGLVTVGSEFRRLRVLGDRADAPPGDQTLSAPSRTRLAIERGEAQSVVCALKCLSPCSAHTSIIASSCATNMCLRITAGEYEAFGKESTVSLDKARLRILWYSPTRCLFDGDIPVLRSRHAANG